MRKKFETHPTRCDYNEQELEAYFNAKKTLYMEGDKSPTIKQIKEKVNNILFANNLNKDHIKDIAIKLRELNPNNIVVLLSKFENNKSLIIITSKNHDVLN